MSRPGWTTRWVDLGTESIEVFTSPDGRRYKHAEKGGGVDLEFPMPYGMSPLQLTNIDHWFGPVETTP